jgi:hypothetical protein
MFASADPGTPNSTAPTRWSTAEILFDSRGERDYWIFLDFEYQAGRIKAVRCHVPIELHAPGGNKVGSYEVDFEVTFREGHVEWHEYKGRWEPLARWKVAHARSEYPNSRLIVIMDREWHRPGPRRRFVR